MGRGKKRGYCIVSSHYLTLCNIANNDVYKTKTKTKTDYNPTICKSTGLSGAGDCTRAKV